MGLSVDQLLDQKTFYLMPKKLFKLENYANKQNFIIKITSIAWNTTLGCL